MKKNFIRTVLPVLLVFLLSSYLYAGELLPEVMGWHNGELRVIELKTISGIRGHWVERIYRTADGMPFKAVWIDGAGEKGWTPASGDADDGRLGIGASYRTLEISGSPALLESHPVTGLALAIKMEGKGTLTLEADKYADEAKLTEAARELVSLIESSAYR